MTFLETTAILTQLIFHSLYLLLFVSNINLDRNELMTPQPDKPNAVVKKGMASHLRNKNYRILSEEKDDRHQRSLMSSLEKKAIGMDCLPISLGKLSISNSRKPGFRPNTSLYIRGNCSKDKKQ